MELASHKPTQAYTTPFHGDTSQEGTSGGSIPCFPWLFCLRCWGHSHPSMPESRTSFSIRTDAEKASRGGRAVGGVATTNERREMACYLRCDIGFSTHMFFLCMVFSLGHTRKQSTSTRLLHQVLAQHEWKLGKADHRWSPSR